MLREPRFWFTLALFLLMMFCGFGFIRTFQPGHEEDVGWRVGYGVAGFLAFLGASVLSRLPGEK